jgi:hypothetical protein
VARVQRPCHQYESTKRDNLYKCAHGRKTRGTTHPLDQPENSRTAQLHDLSERKRQWNENTSGRQSPSLVVFLYGLWRWIITVKKHANNLFAKLGVETRTAAARTALNVLNPQ